ncbi:hypothetical protein ABH853_12775 [Pseudomonas sp. 13.2]|uniref:Uncharacterized protein n=1 Tax=Pseudomonas sp. 13.2 TaxID=3144665 RepID=A0AAU7BM87_9PSED
MRNHSDGGCTQAANAMQQRKEGATIFLLQVAPASAFSDKAHFLLLSGVKNRFFRIKHTQNAPFQGMGMAIGRELHLLHKKFRLHLVAPELSYSYS